MSKKNSVSSEQQREIVRLVNLLADQMLDFDSEVADRFYFLVEAVHPYLKELDFDDKGDGPAKVESDRRASELMARVTPALRKAIVDLFTKAADEMATAEPEVSRESIVRATGPKILAAIFDSIRDLAELQDPVNSALYDLGILSPVMTIEQKDKIFFPVWRRFIQRVETSAAIKGEIEAAFLAAI